MSKSQKVQKSKSPKVQNVFLSFCLFVFLSFLKKWKKAQGVGKVM